MMYIDYPKMLKRIEISEHESWKMTDFVLFLNNSVYVETLKNM